MKTEIFADHKAFAQRTDKSVNGCTNEFAEENEIDLSKEAYNKGSWNCVRCEDCVNCVRCEDCVDCEDCVRCEDCVNCVDCEGCVRCEDCVRCVDCEDSSKKTVVQEIPVIKNIHQALLAAVTQPNAFDMSTWHKCETTHCRAGWIVQLAGEAGKELEKKTSPLFAAMQIYHKSSPNIPVHPPRFYDSNEVAMQDIKRCAELEAKG